MMRLHDGTYSVRERSPFKETFVTESLETEEAFVEWAEVWARVLATDHECAVRDLRVGGKRYSIAEEITRLTRDRREEFRFLVRDQAFDYAKQVEADYRVFKKAMEPGDCEAP